MNVIIVVLFVFLPVALVVGGNLWQHMRADGILRRWAEASEMELVSAEKRYFRTGPFFLYARGQIVFRIVVRDQTGAERRGWIRVGGIFWGMLVDKTKVIWDEGEIELKNDRST